MACHFLLVTGTLHSSLFGPDGPVNYDYIVTNSINCLLIGSRYFPSVTHTLSIVDTIWPMLQNILSIIIYNMYIYLDSILKE